MERYQNKDLIKALDNGKRYIKTNFRFHLCSTSPIKSHNTSFALSDPSNASLQADDNTTNDICSDCFSLQKCLDDITDMVKLQNADEDTIYDVKIAIKQIQNYIHHLVRDFQQRKAKIACFEDSTETRGLWLKDFCQKILPQKYREAMKDYFGKKGMSLHVDLFVCHAEGKLAKKVYFTGIYRCDQAMIDTLAIADAVLDEMKKDFPKVVELFAKSDNAGCYHSNYAAECIRELCSEKGLILKRYDYNEPCCGKDDCDRVSAGAKCVIKSYINAGNDLINVIDLHKALQYGNGVQNAKCGIIEIDSKKSRIQNVVRIANISNYQSVQFKENEMIFWRYFNIGKAIVVRMSKPKVVTGKVCAKEYVKNSD